MQGVLFMINLEKLKVLIKGKGWSIAYFCEVMGHSSRSWLVDMSKGKGIPDENVLRDMADKLDTTVEYLTDKTDIKEQKNKPLTERERLIEECNEIMDNLPKDLQEVAMAQLRSLAALSDKNQKK